MTHPGSKSLGQSKIWGEIKGWLLESEPQDMQTARGEARFNLYEGSVLLDGQELTVEVLGGDELERTFYRLPL